MEKKGSKMEKVGIPVRMRFENRMTEEDYLEAAYFEAYHRRKGWKNPYIQCVILAVLLLPIGVYCIGKEGGMYRLFETVSFAWVGITAVALLFSRLTLKKRCHNFVKKNEKRVTRPVTLELTDDGIYSISGGKRNYHKWKKAERAYEWKNNFFLMVNGEEAVFISKREKTPEQLQDIRDFLIEKLGDRFEKRV